MSIRCGFPSSPKPKTPCKSPRMKSWCQTVNTTSITHYLNYYGGSDGKESACSARDHVRSLGREDPPEKEMATHSNSLAWRIPGTEEPSRLQSMGSQRIRHEQLKQQELGWGGNGESLFNGNIVWVLKVEDVLETSVNLTLLNCWTLKMVKINFMEF